MKTKILIIASILLLNITNIKAQIILEHTLDSVTTGGQFYCTDLGNNDFKYVFLDSAINGFHLYNMDMTPFMTVHVPVAGNMVIDYTAIYITKTLFDCDSTNIEYAYEAPYSGLNKPFYIFRTDGTMLLQVDSANGPYGFGGYGGSLDIRPIINTSDGTKLFLQKSNTQFGSGLQIYSLCGTPPEGMYDFSEHNKSFVKFFPNPTNNELNFEIIPPNNQEEFQLVIYDAYAKEQKRQSLALSQNKYSLDVSTLSSGTYFYSLVSKRRSYQSGKLIITK